MRKRLCPVSTSALSLLSLSEELIEDAKDRVPLERIFLLMRKSGATWLLDHRELHTATYFETLYALEHAEREKITEDCPGACVRVDQLSFFRGTMQWPPIPGGRVYSSRRQRTRPTESQANELLGTLVLFHVDDPARKKKSYVAWATLASDCAGLRDSTSGASSSFVHIADVCHLRVGGYRFEMLTSLYCQQNEFASICAHSTLKATVFHGGAREVVPPSDDTLSSIARRYAPSKSWRPEHGFSEAQCREICKAYDSDLIVVDFENNVHSNISPYELAYLFVEAELPTVILFRPSPDQEDPYHLVPVIGHTLNLDEWFPFAMAQYPEIPLHAKNSWSQGFLSSSEWVSHLLVHDDLLGPYYCVNPNALTRHAHPQESYVGRACAVWAVVPKGYATNLTPAVAQENGFFYFENLWERALEHAPEPWKSRLTRRWSTAGRDGRSTNLVLRTTRVTKESYVAHLRAMSGHAGEVAYVTSTTERAVRKAMSESRDHWMVEFTLPELYTGNLRKIGEVVFPLSFGADGNNLVSVADTAPSPACFRMFGHLHLNPPNGSQFNIGIQSHVALFKHRSPAEAARRRIR